MNTLDEAWQWYEDVESSLKCVGRLAVKHWNELPWEGKLGRDDRFRDLSAEVVSKRSISGLNGLDDQAIVVLFSVFESIVRDRIAADVNKEREGIRHPTLQAAAEVALQGIEQGSFFRVLEPFKPTDMELVEQVNQVRKYRNWVAHGKRGAQPDKVDPKVAYIRLSRFLAVLGFDHSA